MSAFTPAEIDYLQRSSSAGPRLARVATVGADGTPHVTPVGFSYNPDLDTIEIGGRDFAATKKFRDVQRSGRAAVVVDDVPSVDPWRVRGIEVRGRAEAVAEPRPHLRIHPERVVAWGLEPGGRRARDVPRAEPVPSSTGTTVQAPARRAAAFSSVPRGWEHPG